MSGNFETSGNWYRIPVTFLSGPSNWVSAANYSFLFVTNGNTGASGQALSWLTGGNYASQTVTLGTGVTYVTSSAGITTTATGRYLVMGQLSVSSDAGTGYLYGTIGRASGVSILPASTINLANNSNLTMTTYSADGISGGTAHMSDTYLPFGATGTAVGTINMHVIDFPGSITYCSYSIWCTATVPVTSENSMITVLQVAP